MTVFLSKIVGLLLKPLGLGLCLAAAGGIIGVRYRRVGGALLAAGVIGVWICSMPWVGHALLGALEAPFPPESASEVPPAEAIVVLGGGLTPAFGPRLHADMNDAADRLWHAARLYRAGVAPRIIASGGALPWRTPDAPSAPAMATLMESWGVPADSILRESRSTTTHTNAVYTAQLCRERGIDRIVLVTSAWHMRRALATFRATGLTVVPAPADHQGFHDPFTLLSVLPDAEALRDTTRAVHEVLGLAYYGWNGWLDPPDAGSARPEARASV